MTDTKQSDTPDLSRRSVLAMGAVGLAGAATLGVASAQSRGASGMNPRPLAGQTAFITGAARGIGAAVAEAMAEAGADVAAYDILEDIPGLNPMATTRRRVEAHGVRFMPIKGDIRDLAAQRTAARDVERAFGRPIDILVANAGVNTMANFTTEDDEAWETHWNMLTEINTLGTARTLRAVVPSMKARGRSRVILTASTFGRQGNAGNPGYVTSKWGHNGMIKSIALDVGEAGVTVNGVAPTAVRTGLGGPQTAEQRAQSDQWLDENYHALDVGLTEPEQIAPAYVFLAGPSGAMITGSIIDVSAGAAARYTA